MPRQVLKNSLRLRTSLQRRQAQSIFLGTLLSTPLGPALSEALFLALSLGQSCGTSIHGRQDHKSAISKPTRIGTAPFE